MIDKVLKIGVLFDFYGALLTEKQRQCIEMHYLNDLSLAEIALEFSVSRQAVHDILKRAEQILFDYECKLGLIERHEREQHAVQEVHEILAALLPKYNEIPELKQAYDKLSVLIMITKD